MASFRLGKDGKLYRGTAGSQAATEMTYVRDVSFSMEGETADGSSRVSSGWGSDKPVTKKLTIEFNIVNHEGDPDGSVAACKNAFLNETAISLWARDGASGEGPDADFRVTTFRRGEPLRDAQTYDVTCTATTEDRNPTWS